MRTAWLIFMIWCTPSMLWLAFARLECDDK